MKKVCFFSGDITRSGGTERVSSMIANGLAAQGKVQVIFLSLTEQAEEPFFKLHKEMKHEKLADKWIAPGPGYLRIIPRLRRFLKQQEIDIIIDIDIVLDILSIPAAKGLGVKVISWEHFNYGFEMSSLYRKCILTYSVKHTDYVVTLTEGDKMTYMEKLNRKENIAAIYNPMQEVSYDYNDYDGSAEKEKWLITVGHLIRWKGMDYLAEVAVRVLRKFPDWKWLVVGEGEERAFLEEFIEKNQLEEQLILTGRTDDVNAYLRKAQIYVMTSRMEGLPMCLLEAKSFCIPSVSFDIHTGPNEIIEHGVNGYLIKPFDCREMAEQLGRLMGDAELRAQFAKHAQDNVAKFRMESILEHWNQVIEQISF